MKKYNMLIPVAGKAQRFADEGYSMPKPLIMAKTKQIIDWSLESVDTTDCNLIFAVRLDHINNHAIDEILREKFGDDIQIVVVDHDTDGSVSTCLIAKEQINNDMPLIIYTPDVYFQNTFDPDSIPEDSDGFLLTFKANSPAHSYVELDKDGIATRTAEKSVISANAAVGLYYYKSGRMFVDYAEEMVNKNERTKDEFYICPMYNYMIRDGMTVTIKQVEKMHVLGTPQELEFFVDNVCYEFGEKPIALCGDHSGFKTKEKTKRILDKHNIPYIDFGPVVSKDSDYNDFVSQATNAIQTNVCDFAMGFCRTGQGVNLAANHSDGVRGALLLDEYMAEMARRHNCANFFSIPEKYVSSEMLEKIIIQLKNNSFDGGRHMTRMRKTIYG
jgi:RpiB/LacA/LacB family sugar-phosphate isomerase